MTIPSSAPRAAGRGAVRPVAMRPRGGAAPAGTPRRRVLHVEMNEDFTVGGSHQALYDLARSLDRSRYEPVVLFYQDNVFAERLRGHGIEVHLLEAARAEEHRAHRSGRLVAKVAVRFRAVARRLQLLRRLRIDLVHLNDSPRMGADDWLPACRLAGIPCITFAMGDAFREPHPVRRWLFRKFDRVVSISHFVEAAMRLNGVPASRSVLVHLGVDAEALRNRAVLPPEATRHALGIPDGIVLAAMVGNIREWKGQHVVLEALRLLPAADRARLHVLFVGATAPEHADYQRRLDTLVREHGLGDTVTFLGARRDVPDLFRAADFAIHASTIPEPFGLVLVEAMALGCPMIASQGGGPAEIITPGSGLTFDTREPRQLAEHIARLVRDPAMRARLAAGAAQRATQFSVARNVEGVERVYDDLFRTASSRTA